MRPLTATLTLLLLLPFAAMAAPPLSEPPPIPSSSPSVSDILAVRQQIADLVKKESAMLAALNAELAKLGNVKPIEEFGVGRPGKDGKNGRDGKDGAPGLPGIQGIQGERGPPGRDASPTPPPPVDPVWPAGSLYILIVSETEDATPGHAQLFANAALAARLKAKGHKWRIADKDARDKDGNIPADLRVWFEKASGKTLPYLFVVDAAGKTRFEGPLPATADKLVEQLGKVGG